MTRINADLKFNEISDNHLAAEYGELPMVFAALRRSLKTKSKNEILRNIPTQFTLNTGHVRFFYDKLGFLLNRYERIKTELIKRNYKLDENRNFVYDDLPKECFNDWKATEKDNDIIRERIKQKIAMKPYWYR